MRLRTIVAAAVLGTLLIGGTAMPAHARDGDVIRTGACSGRSDWKLKLSQEDGRIEVEYEVDQNVVGDVWRVRIRHDDDLVFAGRRTTRGQVAHSRSGSCRGTEPETTSSVDVR